MKRYTRSCFCLECKNVRKMRFWPECVECSKRRLLNSNQPSFSSMSPEVTQQVKNEMITPKQEGTKRIKAEVTTPKKEIFISPEVVQQKKTGVFTPKKEVATPKKEVTTPEKEETTPKKKITNATKDASTQTGGSSEKGKFSGAKIHQPIPSICVDEINAIVRNVNNALLSQILTTPERPWTPWDVDIMRKAYDLIQ